MKVKTPAGEIAIEISSYDIVRFEQNIKHRILKVISDPNIAYILLMIGIWGIFFELANPGAVFPGVIGAICLILGLYSLQTLPVNWAGLLLIVMAIILFLLEVKVSSAGILALAGIGSMILGSLMLFRSPEPFLRASIKLIISSTLATAAFFVFIAYKGLKAQLQKSFVGLESLIGELGEVIDDFENGKGKVFIAGEIWDAETETNLPGEEIKKGDKVKVISTKGMRLIVEKVK
jgi:Membrane-bound serine protease (ClpP class)